MKTKTKNREPPRSTLFPYTTLFRSREQPIICLKSDDLLDLNISNQLFFNQDTNTFYLNQTNQTNQTNNTNNLLTKTKTFKEAISSNDLVLVNLSNSFLKEYFDNISKELVFKWIDLNPSNPPPIRYSHTAQAINDKLYVFGGYGGKSGNDFLNDLWVYDPENNTWTELEPNQNNKNNNKNKNKIPQKRYSHSAQTINNKMYVFGGYNDTNLLNDLWVYDPTNNSWEEKIKNDEYGEGLSRKPQMTKPTKRDGQSLTKINDKLYLIGGSGFFENLFDIWEYDPLTNIWTDLSKTYPSSRTHHTAINLNNKIYVYGGTREKSEYENKITYYNDLIVYDIQKQIWTECDSCSIKRYLHSAINFENRMFVFGGYDGSTYLNDLWEYDPLTNIWSQKSQSNKITPRVKPSLTEINGRVFLFGGYNNDGCFLNDLWELC